MTGDLGWWVWVVCGGALIFDLIVVRRVLGVFGLVVLKLFVVCLVGLLAAVLRGMICLVFYLVTVDWFMVVFGFA